MSPYISAKHPSATHWPSIPTPQHAIHTGRVGGGGRGGWRAGGDVAGGGCHGTMNRPHWHPRNTAVMRPAVVDDSTACFGPAASGPSIRCRARACRHRADSTPPVDLEQAWNTCTLRRHTCDSVQQLQKYTNRPAPSCRNPGHAGDTVPAPPKLLVARVPFRRHRIRGYTEG